MMDVIIRCNKVVECSDCLAGCDYPQHTNAADRHKQRRTVGMFFGGKIVDVIGNKFVRIRMSAADADNIHAENHPTMDLMWRSDVFDDNEVVLPEPMAEINTYDLDNNITGTRMQRVGTF